MRMRARANEDRPAHVAVSAWKPRQGVRRPSAKYFSWKVEREPEKKNVVMASMQIGQAAAAQPSQSSPAAAARAAAPAARWQPAGSARRWSNNGQALRQI